MCCFSPVGGLLARLRPLRVSATRILATPLADGWQGLVYAMQLSTPAEVAMLLPLPTRAALGDEALHFVNLEGYGELFDDLEAAFPRPLPRGGPVALGAPRAPLPVHRVGAFDASFVPGLADMDRLDPRFRIPAATWAALPGVADRGFAVFQLRKGAGAVHPMALRFASARPDQLFFPTVHIHDGAVHPTARFDHTLFAQGVAPGAGWRSTGRAARIDLDIDRCKGLVDGSAPLSRRSLTGVLPNADTWVDRG